MSALSTLVSPAERPRVRNRAARLHRDALRSAWPGHQRPAAGLSRRVSTVVAAIAPDLPYPRLSLLVRYALWTFLLDDLLDAGVHGPTLDRLAGAVTAVTAGGTSAHTEPVAVELAAVRERLGRYDRTGEVLPRFDAALREAVTGDVDHARLAHEVAIRARRPPTAEQYLPVAAATVNYRSFAYALLMVGPAPLTGRMLDRLDPALWHASYAVRLGNDLRSVARDHRETGLNVLDLHTAAGTGVTVEWVHRAVRQRVRAHRESLPTGGDLAAPARRLARSLRISVGLYQLTDLR